jgi:hypothetical protein
MEGLPSKIASLLTPEIAKAMTVNLVSAVRVTVMVSELSAALPTAYHSSRCIEFPVPVAR